jgi:hypothetical protein
MKIDTKLWHSHARLRFCRGGPPAQSTVRSFNRSETLNPFPMIEIRLFERPFCRFFLGTSSATLLIVSEMTRKLLSDYTEISNALDPGNQLNVCHA